ncbi:uncharacterized protein EI97DRAFT_323307 [Westerdykella ornata]|uniref:N-acetyltransferase domain-containing protein n=1 Tax=Westerdykella ornata TaxID=318751 RepID=A0A6A6JK36_WESOR|nr:uncharacterized protein EI97DRAFT_323307 [Westerdykella ornata]KAF2276832.1 hypothetical protein EI97DRAFT_323307 [Westerdykella ornata]
MRCQLRYLLTCKTASSIPAHLRKRSTTPLAPTTLPSPQTSASPAAAVSQAFAKLESPVDGTSPQPAASPAAAVSQALSKPVSPAEPAPEPAPAPWDPNGDLPNWDAATVGKDPSRGPRNRRPYFRNNNAPPSPPDTVRGPHRNSSRRNGPPRKSHWIKNRDLKPRPDDESDGGAYVDPSWAVQQDDRDDPDYDVKKLVDWNGNWLPGEVDWEGRASFDYDYARGSRINKWLSGIELAYDIRYDGPGVDRFHGDYGWVPMPAYPEEDLEDYDDRLKALEEWTSAGDVVLRHWIPRQIDGASPQAFWRSYPMRAPAPLSDVDLNEIPPFWETFDGEDFCLLSPFDVQTHRLKEDEGRRELNDCVNDLIARKARGDQERIERIMKRRNRPSSPVPSIFAHNSMRPAANIYLRPVKATDAPQIMDIYNHYIKTSVVTQEFQERSLADMVNRIESIMQHNLPWIVAVHKGNTRGRRNRVLFSAENIVGFAYLDEYSHHGSIYRFTADLQIFVHQDHLHHGIGKCLLDRLLSMVHTGYLPKSGYEWACHGEYLKHGCSRRVKVVTVHYPYASNDKGEADLKKMNRFLKFFGFRKAGHLRNVAYKYGNVIDVAPFQIVTSESIDADRQPDDPL